MNWGAGDEQAEGSTCEPEPEPRKGPRCRRRVGRDIAVDRLRFSLTNSYTEPIAQGRTFRGPPGAGLRPQAGSRLAGPAGLRPGNRLPSGGRRTGLVVGSTGHRLTVEHAFGRRRERRVPGGARPLPRLDRVSRTPRPKVLFVSGS